MKVIFFSAHPDLAITPLSLGWAGLVTPNTVVHKLEYRVMNDKGHEDESFELWTELPSENAGDPLSPPILPIAFEFKPRAYLELKAVQVVAGR